MTGFTGSRTEEQKIHLLLPHNSERRQGSLFWILTYAAMEHCMQQQKNQWLKSQSLRLAIHIEIKRCLVIANLTRLLYQMLILCCDWASGPVFRASNLWNGMWLVTQHTYYLVLFACNEFPRSLSKKKKNPPKLTFISSTWVGLAIGQRKIKSIASKRDSEMTRHGQS